MEGFDRVPGLSQGSRAFVALITPTLICRSSVSLSLYRLIIRIQIGMFRPVRVDHTNCLQVVIKTHSFIPYVHRTCGGERTMSVVVDLVIKTIQYTQCCLSRFCQDVYQRIIKIGNSTILPWNFRRLTRIQ